MSAGYVCVDLSAVGCMCDVEPAGTEGGRYLCPPAGMTPPGSLLHASHPWNGKV